MVPLLAATIFFVLLCRCVALCLVRAGMDEVIDVCMYVTVYSFFFFCGGLDKYQRLKYSERKSLRRKERVETICLMSVNDMSRTHEPTLILSHVCLERKLQLCVSFCLTQLLNVG